MANTILTIDLGDLSEPSPYAPPVNPDNVEFLRQWFAKHVTLACFSGQHRFCDGIAHKGSQFVTETICLCCCHGETAIVLD